MSPLPRRHPAFGNFIGSADTPAILGVSRYAGPREAWERIMGLEVERDSAMMRAGVDLEPYVIRRYAEATGHVVDRKRRRRVMDRNPQLGAHIDGWDETEGVVVEAKTSPFSTGYGDPGPDGEGLPRSVRLQAAHQLMVTGAPRAYVPVLLRGYDFRIYGPVQRNERALRDLRDELLDWWEAYVVPMIPPPDDDRGVAQPDDGSTFVPDPVLHPTLRELFEARELKAAGTRREKAARKIVEDAMGSAKVLVAPATRISWPSYEHTETEWKLVAEGYRKAIERELHMIETGDMSETALPPLDELDAIVSLHTSTEIRRRFTPTFDEEEARRLLPEGPSAGGTDAEDR